MVFTQLRMIPLSCKSSGHKTVSNLEAVRVAIAFMVILQRQLQMVMICTARYRG